MPVKKLDKKKLDYLKDYYILDRFGIKILVIGVYTEAQLLLITE